MSALTDESVGWVIRWKDSKRRMPGFFETKTIAIGNAIFNDIDADVYYERMTLKQLRDEKP